MDFMHRHFNLTGAFNLIFNVYLMEEQKRREKNEMKMKMKNEKRQNKNHARFLSISS